MGQRQDQTEIIYGDDCLLGWDAGETPKYIYVRFSQLVKCPDLNAIKFRIPPNDRVFKLTQDPTLPCTWFIDTPPWYVWFGVFDNPLRTYLELNDPIPYDLYFQDTINGLPNEGQIYHNELTACMAGQGAHDGIAAVTWRLETLLVLGLINMETANDLFMEMRPLDDGKKVYKYCKLEDGTNIAILFEPD